MSDNYVGNSPALGAISDPALAARVAVLEAKQSFEFIQELVAAASATLDFLNLSAAFSYYEVAFINLLPGTNDALLGMRVSNDNGVNFLSGAADYNESLNTLQTGVNNPISRNSDRWQIGPQCSNLLADGGWNGNCRIYSPSTVGTKKNINALSGGFRIGSGYNLVTQAGRVLINDLAVNAIRLIPTAGNFTSGRARLYGIK